MNVMNREFFHLLWKESLDNKCENNNENFLKFRLVETPNKIDFKNVYRKLW